MPKNQYKNVVAPLPVDIYAKLKFISEKMGITFPELMRNILDNDFFRCGVDDMFQMIATLPEK